MERMIPESQQVLSPVTKNKVQYEGLLVSPCYCHYAYSILSIIAVANEGVGNLHTLLIFIASNTGQILTQYFAFAFFL